MIIDHYTRSVRWNSKGLIKKLNGSMGTLKGEAGRGTEKM